MPILSYSCSKFERQLTANANGGFDCAACRCSVHDFRSKTTNEIRDILKEGSGRVCGVFNRDQIDNERASKIHSWFRWAFAAIFVLGLTFNANGQLVDTTTVSSSNVSAISTASQEQYRLSGVVTSEETGETLPFVKVLVVLKGVTYGAISDLDGCYSLVLPGSLAVGDQLTIRFEAFMSEQKEVLWTFPNRNQAEHHLNVALIEEGMSLSVGIVFYDLKETTGYDDDPNAHGRTTFSGDDLRWF
jgi:hypothetical protein